jgi:hypothetical protein
MSLGYLAPVILLAIFAAVVLLMVLRRQPT